jgi:hypothetical protein
MFERDCLVWY